MGVLIKVPVKDLMTDANDVLDYLRWQKWGVSVEGIAKTLNLSYGDTYNRLRKLMREGKVERRRFTTTHYYWAINGGVE